MTHPVFIRNKRFIRLCAENHGCKAADECANKIATADVASDNLLADKYRDHACKGVGLHMGMQGKEKKEKVILAIAAIVFSLLSMRLILTNAAGKKAHQPPGSAENLAPGVGAPQAEAAVRVNGWNAPEGAKEGLAVILKDPFEAPLNLMNKMRSAAAKETGEDEIGDIPDVNIQGVIWGGDSSFIFANDKIYRKGDMINDVQILDIDKNGAYFLYNGKRVLVKPRNKIQ